MESFLLFAKKTPLTEDGLPWLKGGDEFKGPEFTARRNTSGRVGVGYLIVRALMAAATGAVRTAHTWTDGVVATVNSRSTPGEVRPCWSQSAAATIYSIPNGEPKKVTYHLPLLWLLEAVRDGRTAADLWEAYADFLTSLQANGKTEGLKPALVRAADELYFWGRYHEAEVGKAGDRFPDIDITDSLASRAAAPPRGKTLPADALTDPAAVRRFLTGSSKHRPSIGPLPTTAGGFVGWQVQTLMEALEMGLNVLATGPTDTGKTSAVNEAVLSLDHMLVPVGGKEGMIDLDFLGALLPKPDGTRAWVDGPLLRAMRQAQTARVTLFIDELTRIPRLQQNLLLDVMNKKDRAVCERMGLAVEGDGPFYVVEVPMMSEIVWAPVANLRFIAAGNLGSDYAVAPLDPAVRRRFDLILEFDYLEPPAEEKLVAARTGVDGAVAHAICLLAQRTRDMRRNADLPGCIGTGSVITWARLCAARKAATLAEVMAAGRLVWSDVVCGRDHLGMVDRGKFDGLVDYLGTAGLKLPAGDLTKLRSWTF